MTDLFSGFNNIYSDDSVWWEQPLTFRQFCESREHMGVKLTETQYSWFESLVGTDPKKIFTTKRKKHLRAILAGKGSGKDMCSSMFQNYILYVLLCLSNPTEYFNLPDSTEQIDIVNVAQNQTQSIKVYFKRFTDRIKKWPWVLKHFTISDTGKILNPELKDPRDTIELLTATARTVKGPIRFHSLHSAAQGYEGLNILMFTIDEGSAFPTYITYDEEGKAIERSNADDMLDVCKSSAESRNWNWFGVLISYPRKPNCFQMRKYKEGLDEDSDIISSKHTQWECLPPEKYSGEWVDWQGFKIPKERLKTANENPSSFKLKYLCETEDTVSRFMTKKFVDEIFKDNLKFIGNFVDTIKTTETGRKYTYKYLDHWEETAPGRTYVFAGDYSKVNDRTSIILAHSEPIPEAREGFDKRVVVDQILIWQPDKKNNIIVSHESLQLCVAEIKHALSIGHASLDQLESALTLESFNTDGIPADKHNVIDPDYIRLKSLVDAGLIDCPYFPLLAKELSEIQFFPKPGRNGGRIDHPGDGSKDVADCLAQVCRIIYTVNYASSLNFTSFSEQGFIGSKQEEPTKSPEEDVDNWAGLLSLFDNSSIGI